MTRIDKVRAVADAGQAKRIDGVLVDVTTARAITAVYDALSPANRATMAAMPVTGMAYVTWKLANR